jgi:hypothetical protein
VAAKKTSNTMPSALANALEYVIATDRTPPYEIDEPNARGDKPPSGNKWQTPKEYALELFKQLGGTVDSRPDGKLR